MELKLAEAQIEAILFTMGEVVELGGWLKLLNMMRKPPKIIHSMMDKYEDESRGIQIIELNGAYQLELRLHYMKP